MTAADAAEPLLEAKDLTVRYGKVTALDGLTLRTPAGVVLAVLGPNGAGKTTFVRTVATLLRPTSGHLRVLGVDVARHPAAVRREIGLAGQFAAVEPSMTGRENLEMTARLFGHHRSAARCAAAAVIDQLSLQEVADRRCARYSGGQRRRLDLGASLVGAPRLLLLDEPTTGLDPSSRLEVWTAIRTLVAAGTDVMLTTHYLDEADALADHIVVIDHGRSIAAGTLAELKANVGHDIIQATATDPSRLDEMTRILSTVTSQPSNVDRNTRRASSTAAGGAAQLGDVIARLTEAQVGIDEIALRRPDLVEVFAALTAANPAHR